jgi:hypothetical protein
MSGIIRFQVSGVRLQKRADRIGNYKAGKLGDFKAGNL